MLKPSLNLSGKALRGESLPLTDLWQIEHMGMLGVVNCVRWQPVHDL